MGTTKAVSTEQTAAERKAAETELSGLIDKFSPKDADLVSAVRRAMRKRLPTAHEVVYEYRDCFVVSFSPSGQGFEGVFAIRGSAEGVRFYFNQGKSLPDPEKLLQGSANARWIELEGASTLTRPAVVSLIDAAMAANRVPYADSGKGSVVVRLTTASKGAKKPTAKPTKASVKAASAKGGSRSAGSKAKLRKKSG